MDTMDEWGRVLQCLITVLDGFVSSCGFIGVSSPVHPQNIQTSNSWPLNALTRTWVGDIFPILFFHMIHLQLRCEFCFWIPHSFIVST